MKLLKIEVNAKSKVQIKYETDYTNDSNESDFVDVRCPNSAPIDLVEAIAKLKPHIISICELPKKMLNDITIRGISFTYKAGAVGVTFTVLKSLKKSKAPIIFDTPTKWDVNKDVLSQLPKGCIEALEEVKNSTFQFLKNRSEQLNLFKLVA